MQEPQMQPWYWRSLPLKNRTGSAVFAALFQSTSGTEAIATLLESPGMPSGLARYSICAGAPRIVNGHPQMWTPPVGEILPFLRQLLNVASGRNAISRDAIYRVSTLPFTGGWLGWLGYDLAWEIEQLPVLKQDPLPFPVAFWYEPECFAVLDHWKQILCLAATYPQQLDEMQSRLEEGQGDRETRRQGESLLVSTDVASRGATCNVSTHSLLTTQEDYETAVRRAKKSIRAGDIFQANLSLRFEAYTTAQSWTIYQALQQVNPSPFASYWQTPWGSVISCSPERLVQLQGDRAQTRPIAGTRRKGVTLEQDRLLAQELLDNAKERAEHIMLVDLERNDLGRVCQWGSVAVNELLTIERYSHVMHLVSNITGTLRAQYDAVDLIRAMFPGGTITGCPKVRCMEIIEELEPVRRSLFYGSCGYLDWRGNLDLNILIRTLLFRRQETGGVGDKGTRGQGGVGRLGDKGDQGTRGQGKDYQLPLTSYQSKIQNLKSCHSPLNIVWGQVGAGIVADSDPEREWYESLDKAQAQLIALKKAEG